MLIQIDFPQQEPFDDEMYQAFRDLAQDIAQEPGLIWKIWTENSEMHEAGGIYFFENETTAHKYLQKHITRLEGFGVTNIRWKMFNVNEALSDITNWRRNHML